MKKIFTLMLLLICWVSIECQEITVDNSFGGRGWKYVDFRKSGVGNTIGRQVLLQKDGSYIVAMQIREYIVLARYLVDGTPDGNFGTEGYTRPIPVLYDWIVSSVAMQSDDKILVVTNSAIAAAGQAPPANIDADFGLVRFNSNGTIDSSFGENGKVTTDLGGDNFAITLAVQSDDKILVGGRRNDPVTYATDFALVRYKSNGGLDKSFGKQGIVITDFGGEDYINSVAIRTDGKIIAAGYNYDAVYNRRMIFSCYNRDGSLDQTFGDSGKLLKVVYGAENPGFITLQSNNKLLVTGTLTPTNTGDIQFFRLNDNGSVDSAFGVKGQVSTDFGNTEYTMCIDALNNGKIVVCGYTFEGQITNADIAIARYNPDGSLDETLDGDGKLLTDLGQLEGLISIAVQDNGKIITVGLIEDTDFSYINFVMIRYLFDGSLDNSFDNDGIVEGDFLISNSIVNAIAVQNDEKIVVAGTAEAGPSKRLPNLNDRIVSRDADIALSRFNKDGSPDNLFGENGKVIIDFGGYDYASFLGIQDDRKIVVAGYSRNYLEDKYYKVIARYQQSGALDSSFATNGQLFLPLTQIVSDFNFALQKDRKILVLDSKYDSIKQTSDLRLTRYNENGLLDEGFGEDGVVLTDFAGGDDYPASLALQDDGKIVVSLSGWKVLSETNFQALIRYNANGSLDNTFNGNGKLETDNAVVENNFPILIQPDGKIIATGLSYNYNTDRNQFILTRFNSDGAIDSSFDGDGKQAIDMMITGLFEAVPNAIAPFSYAPSIALQTNGKIIVASLLIDRYKYNLTILLTRLNTDGSLDNSFGNEGSLGFDNANREIVTTLAVTNNRIYLGGVSIEQLTNRGLLASYKLACTNNEICGNRIDDNCDGQIDEGCNAVPFLTINDITVEESFGKATATVSLSRLTNEPVSVNYFTLDKTAVSKPNSVADYSALSGTLTIPAGSKSGVISINIMNDNIVEDDEYFEVHLYHPVHAAVSSVIGKVTITSNDHFISEPVVKKKAKESIPSQKLLESRKLTVRVQPNPTAEHFTLSIHNENGIPLSITVTDVLGRVIERKEGIPARSEVQLGTKYRAGVYFAEVIQGSQRVVVKMVKQPE